MKVVQADAMGLCFGVRDALDVANTLPEPQNVTIHGELVHNEAVLVQLESRGFAMQEERERAVPETRDVLITAHGISDRERARLVAAGKRLIDTTCPLVRRVHEAARRLQDEGRHVLVIGRPGHVEVRGIIEDLDDCDVVQTADDVKTYAGVRLGIVCQTTTPPRVAAAVRSAIESKNPNADTVYIETVCQPTIDRQQSVEKLASLVDAVVVVGGRNSNNTRQLAELCRSLGTPAFHIASADELRADWFVECETVGITAGTSTLDETIGEVRAVLRRIRPQRNSERMRRTSAQWCRYFRRNREALLEIPWETVSELTPAERGTIAKSVQIFQRGESGQGRHFQRCAARHAERTGDIEYLEAVRLMIAEENRHAGDLGRFLDLAGVGCIQRTWSKGVFRRLCKLAGLETIVSVLVIAEIIAKVYYAALRDATNCPALRRLCAQILRDEREHVRFQSDRLTAIRRNGPRWVVRLKKLGHALLFRAACLVVWTGHAAVLKAGGYGFRRFWRQAVLEFRNAMQKSEVTPVQMSEVRRRVLRAGAPIRSLIVDDV